MCKYPFLSGTRQWGDGLSQVYCTQWINAGTSMENALIQVCSETFTVCLIDRQSWFYYTLEKKFAIQFDIPCALNCCV